MATQWRKWRNSESLGIEFDMAATRAQKIRLSAFLIVVTAIIASTLFYLVGAHLMEIRDEYKIELQGGSGGLEVGSQVRFNDIVAGRVESVRLDKDDPNLVIIWVSMEHGTPITVDTIAVPEMANITGSKMLSMRGGTKESARLKPGDTIKSAASDFSLLTTKVVNISNRLEEVLANLAELTKTDNLEKIDHVIEQVDGITKNIDRLLATNEENINLMVQDARSAIQLIDGILVRADNMIATADTAVQRIASQQNVKQFSTILSSVNQMAQNVTSRTSDEELGQTIQSVNRLVADSNVTVLRLRTDLQRIMHELETSVENINEFTQILIENPSVLISGRSEKERQLPR